MQVPSKPLQPDLKTNKAYVDCYHSLFLETGVHLFNEGMITTHEDYPTGYRLFTFDLTSDLSTNECTYWNSIQHGSVRIDVRFDNLLTETVDCVVYSKYKNILD